MRSSMTDHSTAMRARDISWYICWLPLAFAFFAFQHNLTRSRHLNTYRQLRNNNSPSFPEAIFAFSAAWQQYITRISRQRHCVTHLSLKSGGALTYAQQPASPQSNMIRPPRPRLGHDFPIIFNSSHTEGPISYIRYKSRLSGIRLPLNIPACRRSAAKCSNAYSFHILKTDVLILLHFTMKLRRKRLTIIIIDMPQCNTRILFTKHATFDCYVDCLGLAQYFHILRLSIVIAAIILIPAHGHMHHSCYHRVVDITVEFPHEIPSSRSIVIHGYYRIL